MKTKLTRIVLALFLVVAFSKIGYAQNVQIIHDSPDPKLDSIDVYLITPFGSSSYQDVKFRSTSGYISVPAGLSVRIGIAPGNSSSISDTVYSMDVNVQSGKNYIYILRGVIDTSKFLANPGSRDISLGFMVISDARLNASVPGAFDFFLLNDVPDDSAKMIAIRTAKGDVIVKKGFEYGDTTGYFSMPSGPYIMDVFRKRDSALLQTYFLNLPNNITNNVGVLTYSGFADSAANNNGHMAGWFLQVPKGTGFKGETTMLQRARFAFAQLIHNSADPALNKVDVYVNDSLLFNDLAFRSATPTMEVPIDSPVKLSFAPSNSTSSADAFYTVHTTFKALYRYIFITRGVKNPANFKSNPNGIPIDFGVSLIPGEEMALIAGNTAVKTFHGVTDMGYTDVKTGDSTVIFNNGPYTSVTKSYSVVPAQKTNFQVWDSAETVKRYSFRMDLGDTHDSAVMVLLSGFMDTAANQNGPSVSVIAVLADGQVLTAVNVTSVEDITLGKGIATLLYPNPSEGYSKLAYRLEKSANVSFDIKDAIGRTIRHSEEGMQAAGSHEKSIGLNGYAPGMYFIEVHAGDQTAHQRLILK